ncbi:ABC transporter permease, partial [candidate division KSB1 bacterium]
EFAVLISIGMKKIRLIWVSSLETVFLAFLGAFAGTVVSLPIIFYFHYNPIPITDNAARAFDTLGVEPIFNFSTEPSIFINQAIVVLIIALATALYPALFIGKLDPVKAIKS